MIRSRHGEHVDQVVADDDDGQALLPQAVDEVEHLPGLGHAQRRRRLVEEHHLRVAHRGPGHGDRLPLAAGQRRHLGAHARDAHGQPLAAAPGPRAPCRSRRAAGGCCPGHAPARGRRRGWRPRRGCRTARGPGTRWRSRGPRRPGGLEIETSSPSNRICPLSAGLVPAMTLTRVDLPAPLSPTRATTSPASHSKSTSDRACTAPKRLLTPSSWRSGVSVATGAVSRSPRPRTPRRTSPRRSRRPSRTRPPRPCR